MKAINKFLNPLSMYRLVLYGLLIIIVAAVIASFIGLLGLSGWGILLSAVILVVVCETSNRLLSRLFKAPANYESAIITALILCLIMPPVTTSGRAVDVAATGLLAIATKYLLTWRHKHIFNPAAAGALIASISGLAYASWWVGNPTLFPFVLVLGFLIFQKLERGPMGGVFIVVSLLMAVLVATANQQAIPALLQSVIFSGPLLFLGAVMLTEPSTSPATRQQQLLYGGLVGLLFASTLRIGDIIAVTPQLALIIGNAFAFIVSYKGRVTLTLQEKTMVAPGLYDYAFKPDRPLAFSPGQYMFWTHNRTDHEDTRGNRRMFSLASAPQEKLVRLGIRVSQSGSTFKKYLRSMEPGDTIAGDTIQGDFVLPTNDKQKMIWIAGGIGITPFRSMAMATAAQGDKHDIVLFHFARSEQELLYRHELCDLESRGLRYIPVITSRSENWHGLSGHITASLLRNNVPDYEAITFYISGPNSIINASKQALAELNVPSGRIKHDVFSGY